MKKVFVLILSALAISGLVFFVLRKPRDPKREAILEKARDVRATNLANEKLKDHETKNSNIPEGVSQA